jgi:hypothetical protein
MGTRARWYGLHVRKMNPRAVRPRTLCVKAQPGRRAVRAGARRESREEQEEARPAAATCLRHRSMPPGLAAGRRPPVVHARRKERNACTTSTARAPKESGAGSGRARLQAGSGSRTRCRSRPPLPRAHAPPPRPSAPASSGRSRAGPARPRSVSRISLSAWFSGPGDRHGTSSGATRCSRKASSTTSVSRSRSSRSRPCRSTTKVIGTRQILP